MGLTHEPLEAPVRQDERAYAPGWKGRSLTHRAVRVVARPIILLSVFIAADRLLVSSLRLPVDRYERPAVILGLLEHLLAGSAGGLLLLAAATAVIGALIWKGTIGLSWPALEDGPRIRVLVGTAAILLAWVFSTYEYNAYFGQEHEIDRLLLMITAALLLWRPAFVLPFLIVLLPLMQQFHHPIGGYSAAEAMLPTRLLILFLCTLVLSGLTRHAWSSAFIFLTCCLLAAHYWAPGLGKLTLGWISRDQIQLLLPATYANGWLGFLDAESIGSITRQLAIANVPMKFVAMAAELGALFSLWSKPVMRVLIILWIALHAGIFLLSGIFFWMWIVLNAVLLLLYFRPRAGRLSFFTLEHFLLSVLIIAAGDILFKPAKLAWLDASVSYTYRFEAVGADGLSHAAPPRFFAPYDYQFTLGNFHYLHDAPHLPIVWGATSRPVVVDALKSVRTAAEISRLERVHGRVSYDARRSAAFDALIRRFFVQQEEARRRRWWRVLPAPPELWTFPLVPPRPAGEIDRVIVYQIVSHFDGQRYRELRRVPVRIIDIDAGDERRRHQP